MVTFQWRPFTFSMPCLIGLSLITFLYKNLLIIQASSDSILAGNNQPQTNQPHHQAVDPYL